MYISAVSHYLPEVVVPNSHFEELNGLTSDWIIERTGILERRKASADENTNTMAVEAIKNLQKDYSDLSDVDLIVAASYTAYDNIVTIAHHAQFYLGIPEIPAVMLSSACSSFLNAMELVEGYFAMNKSKKALVLLSEHNTAYNHEENTKFGHLWGDGAVALIVSKEKIHEDDLKVEQIITGGAATAGVAIEAVNLKPFDGGLSMPNGRDVFINACNYMSKMTLRILSDNGLDINDLSYLITHQANLRIAKNVVGNLDLPLEKALNNIQYLGNTGCAGSGIVLSENIKNIKEGDNIVVTVFGGGYSYGAMLLKK